MKSSAPQESNLNSSSQTPMEKTPSDFWKVVRTNIKLQHQAPPIRPLPRDRSLPLSFGQKRLWLIDQLQPGNSVHNMRAAYQLKGLLNVTILEQSLLAIVQRHEILRTTFPIVDGQPIQLISPDIAFNLPLVDLRELPLPQQESEVQGLFTQEFEQPFDLISGLLWRVKLLRLAEKKYILLWTAHHIIFDGWSYSVYMRELAVLYKALSTGKASPLPELPIQYADFAQSQRQWLQGEVLASLVEYWKQQLGGSVPPLELPIDHPRPGVPTYRGGSQSLVLPKYVTETLKALSYQEGVSLFVTLLAAFKALLHGYTGQKDIILCSPIAGRNRVETKRLIGYFNNIVVMRTDLSGNPTFRELISRVSQVSLGANKHQDLPFQKLTDFPNLVRIPLNRGMFALQNTPPQPQKLADIAVTHLDIRSEAANFDLFLSMTEKKEELTGVLYYKTDLFNYTTITSILEHFQTLLESIVANPDQYLELLLLQVDLLALELPNQIKQEPASTFVIHRDELELQVTKIWEKVLGIQPISMNDNFFDLGGHSILAVSLFAEIEKTLGKNLPLSTLFQAPTVEQIVSIIRQQSGWSTSWSSLVAIQPKGSKPPLFCIHDVFGDIISYRDLADYLGTEQPIYGLQAQGLDGKQVPHTQIGDMAACYIKEIQTLQPSGPYFLAGHSLGGVIAFEMAQQLWSQDQKVALLVLLDSYAPGFVTRLPFFKRVPLHLDNLLRLGLSYIWQKSRGWAKYILKQKLQTIVYKFYLGVGYPLPRVLRNLHIRKNNEQAAREYVPQVYSGRVALFLIDDELRLEETTGLNFASKLGWGELVTGGLEIHYVPGNHSSILKKPNVNILAKKLQACLASNFPGSSAW